ncbi:MAG TPA: hypothetical protein VNB64_01545 [Solirubrobacteraceae bacterium]|nr:hypothetical protein [Solirubrobacteraceae bacterium]
MSSIDDFFEEYRTTFARYDADALAALFAFPFQAVSATDDGAAITASATVDEWRPVLEGLLGMYRTLGVAEGEPLQLHSTELTEQTGSARVHWQLRRDDGSTIYEFTAVYTLARVNGAWRVAGIVHDELPKLQAALASA